MRHIPTSADKVDSMKRQAKRLQRNGGGKHAELLDRVARQNGYLHWHHVTLCAKETRAKQHGDALIVECQDIASAELAGRINLVVTGPESSTSQPFVLMSTGIGDAWLLDPHENRAACIVWRGVTRDIPARIVDDRLMVLWDGTFELLGAFFRVKTDDPSIGTRGIAGYPLEQLREVLERARSVDDRMHAVFDQPDALDLTEELIAELTRGGWDEANVRSAAAAGGRYSPIRNSILFPVRAEGLDAEDLDHDGATR